MSARFRNFRAGDELHIATLFERGFDRQIDEATWKWKYRQAPEDNVRLAVDDDDRPVFHYGGVPRTWALAGDVRPAMTTFDAVTHPDFRRQGLFSAAMKASHGTWADDGIAAVLGLPNEQWGTRVTVFDWRPLFPLRWRIRPLRPEAMLAKRTGVAALGSLRFLGSAVDLIFDRRSEPAIDIRESTRADELAEVWERCWDDTRIGLVRDREWLDGRYFQCPTPHVTLAAYRNDAVDGYLVYRYDDEHRYGFVADIFTRPNDDAVRRALLTAAVSRLKAQGAVAAASLAIPGSEVDRSLRRGGFLLGWGDFTVRCVPLADDLPFDSLKERRRWWLSGGDFDVI